MAGMSTQWWAFFIYSVVGMLYLLSGAWACFIYSMAGTLHLLSDGHALSTIGHIYHGKVEVINLFTLSLESLCDKTCSRVQMNSQVYFKLCWNMLTYTYLTVERM